MLMKQEIIEVIKKYIDVDEEAIDVHLTNKSNDDGTVGAPALYANIPIVNIKNEMKKVKWPNKKEMIKYSCAALTFIIVFAVFFSLTDLLIAGVKTLVEEYL